jgi:hypothetical protein
MKKYTFRLIFLSLFIILFSARLHAQPDSTKHQMVGGQTDKHGCLVAAGYTWSNVNKTCLRLFEKGIALNPGATITTKGAVTYLLFNENKTQAEIFVPGIPGSVILNLSSHKKMTWKKGDWILKSTGKYMLFKKGVVQYSN